MRRIVRAIFRGWLVTLFALTAHATEATSHISQLGHSVWRVQDGVLNAAPTTIVQTKDGYLWVGTETGLLRFDGVRFVPFVAPGWDQIQDQSVTSLLAASDGTLWIGTPTALASWSAGKLSIIAVQGHTNEIVEDRQKRIWASFTRKAGQPLCEVSTGRAKCFGSSSGLPLRYADALAVDKQGGLLLASADVLVDWSMERGLQSTYNFDQLKRGEYLHGIATVFTDSDGSSLVSIPFTGKARGLQRIKDGKLSPYTAPGLDGASLESEVVYRDRSGSLWIGSTAAGVFRINQFGVEHFTSKEGLSGDAIRNFTEDSEGNLWIATGSGIDCFRDLKILTWSGPQGLPLGYVVSILAASDGSVWLGSQSHLTKLRGSLVRSIGRAQGLPGDAVTALLQDRSGRIWLGVGDQLAIYNGHHFTLVKGLEGKPFGIVSALALDADGSVWAALIGQHHRVVHIKDEKLLPDTLTSAPAAALSGDSRPGVWTVSGSQLGHYTNGVLQTISLGQKGEATNNTIAADLVVTFNGTVYVSTSGGVWGIRDGKAQRLGTANGLPCQNANGLMISARQQLVVRTTCGLLVIAPADLGIWWMNPQAILPYQLIDSFDGARLSAATFPPQMSRAPDGRIWIGNEGGIQVFDADHVPTNEVPPPVHIEQIYADHRDTTSAVSTHSAAATYPGNRIRIHRPQLQRAAKSTIQVHP